MIRDRNQRKQLWLNLRQSASRRPSAPCRRLYLGGNSATIHCDGRLGHCSCTSAPRHQRVTSHAATSWWTADGTGKQRRAKGACYDQRRATIDHPAGHHAGGRAGPVGDLVVVSDSRGAVDLVWHVRAVLPGRQPGRGGRAGGRELLVRRRHPAGGGRPGAGVALLFIVAGILGVAAAVVTFAWPGRTLYVVSILVAWYLIILGVSEIFAAFSLREAGKRVERLID